MPRLGSRVRASFSAQILNKKERKELVFTIFAQVAELVDAHVSGACAERCAGSSPVLGTLFYSAFMNVGGVAELVDALL